MDISDSPAKGRSFCKIVLSEISLHDKLMIPGKFVRKYGKYLRVRVYLKASRGEVWPVDLVGYSGELWLQNGWPEFARFYSLCFGNFLVFKYQGNSHFDVFIYDKSGIEKDYPLVSTVANTDEQDNHNLSSRQSTQAEKRTMSDIDELKACKKTRANSACIEACHIGECLMRKPQHQKIAEVTSDKALEVTSDDNIQPVEMLNPTKLELDPHNPLHQDRVIKGASGRDEGNSKALASAKVSKSHKPSFVLTVVPSYLGGVGRVDIKKGFAARYMRSTRNFKVCLQVEERNWPVTCTVCRNRNRYRFCKGWSKFATGNSLSVGDVCVFELIDQAQMLLKVFIHRPPKC